MDVSLTEALTVYGPLGIMALIGLLIAGKLFRVLQQERDGWNQEAAKLNATHKAEIQRIATEHKAEMQAMVDRYIQTTTSQVEQYHNLADKIGAVLSSLSSRVRR
jgi:hypothetical protein